MLSCSIDAHEGQNVATVDLPGAFIQTNMPDDEPDVHVMMEGRIAELLEKINPPTYHQYVHKHRGKLII